jgi:hypothetical protein
MRLFCVFLKIPRDSIRESKIDHQNILLFMHYLLYITRVLEDEK